MKRFVLFTLCLLLIMSPSYVAFADAGDDVDSKDFPEGFISASDAELIQSKLDSIDYWYLESESRFLVEPIVCTINVPFYVQANQYYCGPATLKAVLQFHLGTSKTQQQYASQLGTTQESGTDMSAMKYVLNQELGSQIYVLEQIYTSGSQTAYYKWSTRVRYSIDQSKPAILDINTMTDYTFPYQTQGHYVATCGYQTGLQASELTEIQISDPHYNYAGISWYPVTNLFNATMRHHYHGMI